MKTSYDKLFSKLLFIKRMNESDIFDENPMKFLEIMKIKSPRQVCQYQFRRNDIVWICRSCQRDETCVLCNECYQLSSHIGHEVYFYHSQAGGCCDCGDPEAWAPKGFCTKHGKVLADPLQSVPSDVLSVGISLLDAVIINIVRYTEHYAKSYDILRVCAMNQTDTNDHMIENFHSVDSLNNEDNNYTNDQNENQNDSFQSTVDSIFNNNNSNNNISTLTISLDNNMGYHDDNTINTNPTNAHTNTNQLYHVIVLNDDVHTEQEVLRFFYELPIPHANKADVLVNKINTEGYAIIFSGTIPSVRQIALALSKNGLQVCILSTKDLKIEKIVSCAISWLYKIAQSSDGICRMVCNALSIDRLQAIFTVDGMLCKPICSTLHGLFLTLMADQSFKMSVAIAYARAFPYFSDAYGKGIGTYDGALFGLSVQFLNRAAFVAEMVIRNDFLVSITEALYKMLSTALTSVTQIVKTRGRTVPVPTHPVLIHRRYNPLFGDLKVVFSTAGKSQSYHTAVYENTFYVVYLITCVKHGIKYL